MEKFDIPEKPTNDKEVLTTLWRGMYGDSSNQRPGMIQDVREIKAFMASWKKYGYIGLGIIMALQVFLKVIEHNFFK